MVEEEAYNIEDSGGFTLTNTKGMMLDGLQSQDGGRISNHRP